MPNSYERNQTSANTKLAGTLKLSADFGKGEGIKHLELPNEVKLSINFQYTGLTVPQQEQVKKIIASYTAGNIPSLNLLFNLKPVIEEVASAEATNELAEWAETAQQSSALQLAGAAIAENQDTAQTDADVLSYLGVSPSPAQYEDFDDKGIV